MTRAKSRIVAAIARLRQGPMAVNPRALLTAVGIPKGWLKSKKAVEATRRRSEAAKMEWVRRKATFLPPNI